MKMTEVSSSVFKRPASKPWKNVSQSLPRDAFWFAFFIPPAPTPPPFFLVMLEMQAVMVSQKLPFWVREGWL